MSHPAARDRRRAVALSVLLALGAATAWSAPAGDADLAGRLVLTHTSGIKSYTNVPGWDRWWREDRSVRQLVDRFNDQPPDFAPGERWLYDNSGYVLLGAIVEKVTGEEVGAWVGVYRIDPQILRVVTREEDRLFTQRQGYSKLEAFAAAPNDFFYQDTMDRLRFLTDATGKVTGLAMDRRYGGEEKAVRVDDAKRPAPAKPHAMRLARGHWAAPQPRVT